MNFRRGLEPIFDEIQRAKTLNSMTLIGRHAALRCPPWPVSNLIAYLRRLSDAFGWRYVASVLMCYGINQGVGESLMFYARRYYMLDNVGIDSKTYGQLIGFGDIPWQLKSLFGVLSDTVPIFGMHRAPYMAFAGVVGVVATSLLSVIPATGLPNAVYGLIFFAISLNFAMPDVMIDATVAERSKQRPEYAAELQALCWGAINSVGLPFEMAKGYMLEALGAKPIFAVCIGAAACVLVPPCCGWIEGRPSQRPRGCTEGTRTVRTLCSSTWQHEHKRAVVGAALVVGLFSFALGLVNLLAPDWEGLTHFCLGSYGALCVALYLVLRPVDATLAGAVVYTFASRAVCPTSSVVFEWLHDPGPPSHRCWTVEACAALNATPAASALTCGWAKARDYPCIDPITVSWIGVAGRVALVLGVWFYVSLMQHWPFRRTFVVTQTLICAFSFFDLLWIRRVNRALGLSDSVWCLFGNELAQDFVYKLNQMPFMIYAAKLCPRGTEASMFALFMGLSNFGTTAGGYLGSSLMQAYGGVEAPEFENLETFVMTACLMQAVPILMVPFLVPRGSPVGTAQEMGAGRAILGDGQDGMPPEITSCCRASSELSCSRDDIEVSPLGEVSSLSEPVHSSSQVKSSQVKPVKSSSAAHYSKSMSQRRAEPLPDADVVVVRA